MSQSQSNPRAAKKSGVLKLFATLGIVISGLYLLNPTFGLFELIPDNTPLIGNLDEAAATALLLTCLAQLGLTLPGLRRNQSKAAAQPKDKDVIDV